MTVSESPTSTQASVDPARERAKRITLVLLWGWVALVFLATVLKFAKVW